MRMLTCALCLIPSLCLAEYELETSHANAALWLLQRGGDEKPSGQCENCNGTGKLGDGTIEYPCPVCGGDGKRDFPAAENNPEVESPCDCVNGGKCTCGPDCPCEGCPCKDGCVKERTPRLIVFGAKWCLPCKRQRKALERPFKRLRETGWKISERIDAHIQLVDVDEQPELANACGVKELPQIVKWDGERVRHRVIGAVKLDEYDLSRILKGVDERSVNGSTPG